MKLWREYFWIFGFLDVLKIIPKQLSVCASLALRNVTLNFTNLNEKDLLDNKLFWKTMKLSLSDKGLERSL